MDDIKTPKTSRAQIVGPARRVLASHNSRHLQQHATIQGAKHIEKSEPFDLDKYVRTLKRQRRQKLLKYTRTFQKLVATTRRRIICGMSVAALLVFVALPALQEVLNHKIYALSPGENAVLLPTHQSMADKLKLDAQKQTYMFNQDYKPSNPATDIQAGGSLIKAEINQDPSKGLQVTDAVNNVDFTIKPLFNLGTGQQQQNRVVFPAFNGGGHLVYTAGAIGVKQDVTLDHNIGDNLKYGYELELGDAYMARLEKNGSIGVYGSSLPLNGNISTGDAKDAALLKKARQNAAKDKLLFELPAPKIKETNHHISNAQAKYELKGNTLNVVVTNLKSAAYPLSIDPTVTAASGYGLFSFDANIETNVYIDPSNNFIQRSSLTGGNLLTWGSATSSAAVPHFLGAAVVYGGTLYLIGGAGGTTTTNISNGASSHLIEQSKINSDGTLAGFTDGNYSGLPSGGLARFQVLTYNGYIYLIDGINGFTSTAAGGTVSNNVYYTRVTSESYSAFTNGSQLKNWITTTNKPSTAVYDYGATVYNGSLYVAGGLNSGGTGQTALLYSNILPSGDLGTFNSGTALSAARSGMDMQAYNGHLYILGGNTGNVNTTTLTATTLYASIAADGSIADASWKSGPTLVSSDGSTTQVMENLGAQFTMIYNGYIYATGACGVVNASSACTTVLNYTQLAQINADGSLGTFFPNDFQNGGTATLARIGTTTFGYNGAMYSIGGCSAMNAGSVSCATTAVTSTFAGVNATIGDISNNRNPTALPVALYGQATVVLNGYLYLIGGCLNTSCDGSRSSSFITYYALINSDGSLGSWSNNTLATNATALRFDQEGGNANCTSGFGADQCGLSGLGATVYNGYIYVVGGYDGNNFNNAVYYQQPNASNGQTTTWTKSGNTIANASAGLGMFAHNGFLYVMGGCTGTSGLSCTVAAGNFFTQVQRSTIGAAGAPGAFTGTGAGTQMQLSAGIATFGIAYYGGFIYLAGGTDFANAQESTIQRAKLDSSGNVVSVVTGLASGTWTNATGTMSQPRRRTVAAVVNGYLYVIGGHNAADATGPPGGANGTTYGDIQIGKIDLSSGSTGNIASFTQSASSTLTPRWNPAIAFGDGFMYVTGGCTVGPPPGSCTTVGTTNESFVVYNADNLGVNTWNSPAHTYAASSPDPAIANRLGAGSVAYNGYLYVVGGCTTYTMATLTCSLATTDVVYAPINADGTLGTWVASTALGFLYADNQLVALNGTLYLLTGQNSTGVAKSVVRYSVIGANGALGTWTDSSNSLPVLRTLASVTVYANRIYVAGGWDGTTNSNVVYFSPALPTGGDISTTQTCPDTSVASWCATTSSFTTARRELSLVTAGAYLYVIGGYDGTNYYKDVQYATPNTSTGNVTSWSFAGEIPYNQASMSAVGSNGYIYLFGGRNGTASTSCSNRVSFAAVNGNGTLGDWQQPANTLATARFGTGLGYSNGYFFLSGGHDCTNIISSNVVQQSGQLSEAIHATYTRYVDFGTDATFRQLYVLGTNAQISGTDIDRWKIIVKTSTSINNSWGQKFTTTLTGLDTGPNYGTPITFQALDASGVDQGAAQFWDLTFDIDQSQSFNFPDTTQPQITKYDFYFSPGPGKRLRDGKTFINETQTTLDAHP